jgi:hypothetical protein
VTLVARVATEVTDGELSRREPEQSDASCDSEGDRPWMP